MKGNIYKGRGRPRQYQERLRSDGLTKQQYEWLVSQAALRKCSRSDLQRVAVWLMMAAEGEEIPKEAQAEVVGLGLIKQQA